MKKTGPESWKSRLQGTVLWLLPVALGWGVLALLAHQPTRWAILWTQNLFGWTLLLSHVCIWGAVIAFSRDARRMLIRAISVNLTVAAVIICLEVAAGLKLVHWRRLFEKMGGEAPVCRYLRVETAIAGHPPHRSGRDQFGHPVPR